MKRDKSNRAWATRPRAAWPGFLADALRSSLQRHESLRRQCAKRSLEGPIHDLRVETRRQLALTVLAGETCGIRTDKIRQSLKRYLRNTAKLRDAQVQLAHVDQRMVEHPELRALHRRLRRLVGGRMRATEKKLGRRRKKLHRRI